MELIGREMNPSRRQAVRTKLAEWGKRYALPELVGTAFVLGSVALTRHLNDNMVLNGYAGTVGENVGFYGTILIREIGNDRRAARQERVKYGWRGFLKTTRNLTLEFGLAEAVDSLLARPLAIGLGEQKAGIVGAGVGKIAVDVAFYIPAVVGYELRKRAGHSNRTIPPTST